MLILVSTCHLTVTSFSWSTDLNLRKIKFSCIGHFLYNHTHMLTIFDPHIDHGGYMSASHVSPDLDLISWSADLNLAKFSSNFCDSISFSITIHHRLTIFCSLIQLGMFQPALTSFSWSTDLNLVKFTPKFLWWRKFLYYHTT